jgi:hypothetical protein
VICFLDWLNLEFHVLLSGRNRSFKISSSFAQSELCARHRVPLISDLCCSSIGANLNPGDLVTLTFTGLIVHRVVSICLQRPTLSLTRTNLAGLSAIRIHNGFSPRLARQLSGISFARGCRNPDHRSFDNVIHFGILTNARTATYGGKINEKHLC